MRQPSSRAWICLAAFIVAAGLYAQEKSLRLGTPTGREVTVPVTMTCTDPVQGFVLAVAFDTTKLTAMDARAAGATVAAGVELVVSEIIPEGLTMGVVLDFNPPYDGQTIPGGTDQLIAEVDMEASLALPCGTSEDVPLVFADDLNDPPLNSHL